MENKELIMRIFEKAIINNQVTWLEVTDSLENFREANTELVESGLGTKNGDGTFVINDKGRNYYKTILSQNKIGF